MVCINECIRLSAQKRVNEERAYSFIKKHDDLIPLRSCNEPQPEARLPNPSIKASQINFIGPIEILFSSFYEQKF